MDLSKLKYSKKNSDRTPADVPLHKLAIEGTEEGGTFKTLDVSQLIRSWRVFFLRALFSSFPEVRNVKKFSFMNSTPIKLGQNRPK